MDCSTSGFPVYHQLPELSQTPIHQVSDAIQPSYPLSSPSPPAPNPSQHQSLFQLKGSFSPVLCITWPKYWSFSFSISPSNEYLGLISLQSKGMLKSLLQHHSSTASILQHSAFFMIQLSHLYMTTGKTIDLTRRTFVGKVMSLLLCMLSRLAITFLPRSKHLLISWLQSPSVNISLANPAFITCSLCGPGQIMYISELHQLVVDRGYSTQNEMNPRA